MSLRRQVSENGLSSEQAETIYREELRAYRDELVHLEMQWKAVPTFQAVSDRDTDLSVYRSLWRGLSEEGLGANRDWDFVDRHFGKLDCETRQRVRGLLRDHPDLEDIVRADTGQRLRNVGVQPNAFNLAYAVDLVLRARAQASDDVLTDTAHKDPSDIAANDRCRAETPPSGEVRQHGKDQNAPSSREGARRSTVQSTRASIADSSKSRSQSAEQDNRRRQLLGMTPCQVAEEFIKEHFLGLEHRTGSKRRKALVGDPTLRDIRWAAKLLQKSLPAGATFASVTADDYKNLDAWFDRIPVTIGKSHKDRDPATTLEEIEKRAIERLEKGELTADQFGLSPNTSNNRESRRRADQHSLKHLPPRSSTLVLALLSKEALAPPARRKAGTVAPISMKMPVRPTSITLGNS